jgi:SAM-dependent methyltransferase
VSTDGEAERNRIERVYTCYRESGRHGRSWSADNRGNQRILDDCHGRIESLLRRFGAFPSATRPLLDVGCGDGDLLVSLRRSGAPADALLGVDLLTERVEAARARVPGAEARVADARRLPFADRSFGAVVLSTVLSSVIDPANRAQIAAEALRVVCAGGVVLCYDARLPNPMNPHVRAISRRELARVFKARPLEVVSLTLLPPLARRLGPATDALYGPLLRFPLLRTHLLAAIRVQGP